jgi:hypothetical protein
VNVQELLAQAADSYREGNGLSAGALVWQTGRRLCVDAATIEEAAAHLGKSSALRNHEAWRTIADAHLRIVKAKGQP